MSLINRKICQKSSIFVLETTVHGFRHYSSKSKSQINFKKIRPMILKRIEDRANDYPIKSMLPVARQVLTARKTLYDGVSTLIRRFPIWVCKYCPEVYVDVDGHSIRTCRGYNHHAKNKVHTWVKGTINDAIVPVETFHLQEMFQKIIRHDERFNHDRIPAVLELCLQAGISSDDKTLAFNVSSPDIQENNTFHSKALSKDALRLVGIETLKAWETVRSGVHKLLFVYPARVCKHCSEVHVGPSGHKARMCGVFKYESWRGTHFWQKAKVDDLVPPKIVWYRRRQDRKILAEKGREFYGRAPVVVDLCSKAGAIVPSKYFCMMKFDGLSPHRDTMKMKMIPTAICECVLRIGH